MCAHFKLTLKSWNSYFQITFAKGIKTIKHTTYSRHGSDEVEQVLLEIFPAAANDSTANHHMQSVSGKGKRAPPSHVSPKDSKWKAICEHK